MLRSDAFFVRRIQLDEAATAVQQAELALETGAPFGVDQLFYGFLRAADGRTALVFATHRRLFPGDEWTRAVSVMPAFIGLLGDPPAGPRIRLWQEGELFTAAAWDDQSTLPALVLSRSVGASGDAATRDVLVAETRRRLGQEAEVEEFTGPVQVNTGRKRQEVEMSIAARDSARRVTAIFDRAAIESMDVRDKAVLTARRQSMRRDNFLWLGFATSVAGIGLALLLDLGNAAGGALLKKYRVKQDEVAGIVRKIETAQTLSARIEEMSQRRLQPLEMLETINKSRPESIRFVRVASNGQNTLEIDAQTPNASSVGAYETALKANPALKVEIRDLRLREGVTTFQLIATFKPGTVPAKGGP